MGVHQNLTGAQRTSRYRAAKRAQGMRLKQIWVPDLNDPKVRARLLADAASLAAQGNRWADIIDDAEAMSAEVLSELPPYDWGDDPRGDPERPDK